MNFGMGAMKRMRKIIATINTGTLCFQDNSSRGPRVPEHSYRDTSFQDVPSPHLKSKGRKIKYKFLNS